MADIRRWLAWCVVGLTILIGVPAGAQGYPNKPIKIVAPFAPGGGSDVIGRVIAERLAKNWGQPVIVENRPGAGGSIGTEFVANSPADGYTLLITDASSVIINPFIYPKLGYTAKNFTPVVNLAELTLVMLVPVKSPINTLADVIAAEKAKPGSLSGASPGAGSTPHLMLEMMNSMAGTKLVHVPYKGGGPAINDLVAGHVDFSFSGLSSQAMSLISGGRLKAVFVTTRERNASLPAVPTLAESGFPGADFIAAISLLAPAGTPPEIVAKLHQEVVRILATPEVKARWKESGYLPREPQSPAQTGAWFSKEIEGWSKFIKEKNIVAE